LWWIVNRQRVPRLNNLSGHGHVEFLRNFLNMKSLSTMTRRYAVLIAFTIGCLSRLIPELIAHPYPIGYDVINYYIPVITNFNDHWQAVSEQFPLYVVLLYSIHVALHLDPQVVVTVCAIITFGIFGVSLYTAGRRLLKLDELHCLFLAVFVMFQIPILRTEWDLHKDIFSLTTLLLTLSSATELKDKIRWPIMLVVLILGSVTVIGDRMVGALIIGLLTIYTLFTKNKAFVPVTLVTASFFIIAIVPTIHVFSTTIVQAERDQRTNGVQNSEGDFYNPKNLIILFGVVNGPLVPLAIIGFKSCKNALMKIPVILTTIASFSWVVFPDLQSLVADRWIFISGLFLSILAAYGIIRLLENTKGMARNRIAKIAMLFLILAIPVTMGLLYQTQPYQHPLSALNIFDHNLESFIPITMQFNSIEITYNENLLSMIAWINQNTSRNAIIIVENHWRGWMELKLDKGRGFLYVSALDDMNSSILKTCGYDNCYLMTYLDKTLTNIDEIKLSSVHKNESFITFRIETN
jgi:hypothetical protein